MNTKVILDKAFGRTQNIQLFCTDTKSCESRFCKIDAVILTDDRVKLICEIEESNIGKAAVSRTGNYFIHRTVIYPKADKVFFVQILGISASEDKRKPSKKGQLELLEPALQNLLDPSKAKFQYDIFYGLVDDFRRDEAQQELVDHVHQAVAT